MTTVVVPGLELGEEESRRVFGRDRAPRRLDVHFGGAYYDSEEA